MRLFPSLLGAAGVLALGLLLTPSTSRYFDCGGNVEALSNASNLAQMAMAEMADAEGHSFRFAEAPNRCHEPLRQLSRIRKARFLVTKHRIAESDETYPQLIAVCDTPYRNVPQRRFWRNPPTHAAAYSDGSTKLISPEEFAALPQVDFIPLEDLYPRAPREQ
jgi:hypothetical protein